MYHQCKGCETYIPKAEGNYCMLCKEKKDKLSFKAKLYALAIAVVICIIVGIGFAVKYRATTFYDCVMRQIEENRETDYTWWRGRCFYVQKDGTQIPVIQARTIAGGHADSAEQSE